MPSELVQFDYEDVDVVLSDSEDDDFAVDLTLHPTISNGVVSYRDEQGLFHRERGPAIISETAKQWFIHGVRHRSDGPAVIITESSGRQVFEYWHNGVRWGPSAQQPPPRPTRTFLR